MSCSLFQDYSWITCHDPSNPQHEYYYNYITGGLSWIMPKNLVCIKNNEQYNEFYAAVIVEDFSQIVEGKPTLEVHKDETVLVIKRFNKWIYAINSSNNVGFIPDACASCKLPEVKKIDTHSSLETSNRVYVFTPKNIENSRVSSLSKVVIQNISEITKSLKTYHLSSDLNLYNIYEYSEMYFRRSKNLFASRAKRMQYSSSKLHSSLTILNELDSDISLKISELILSYTEDSKKGLKRNTTIRQQICENCLLSPALIDEGYCQLIRHTSNNKNEESELLGWELLAYFTSLPQLHKVSPIIYPYILNYFVRNSLEGKSKSGYAYYCVKAFCLDDNIEPLNESSYSLIRNSFISNTIFNCSLAETLRLEQKMSLYYNHGLLGQFDPVFGAIPEIARNKIVHNIYFSPEAIYLYLTKGAVMSYRLYNSKLDKGLIRINNTLNTLVISSPDNSKILHQYKLNIFFTISCDRKEFIDDNNSDDQINSSFILLGNNRNDSIQITTGNVPEKNRWYFTFQTYFLWFQDKGRLIDLESLDVDNSSSDSLKRIFVSYLYSIILNPNDFYSILLTGETFSYFNSSTNEIIQGTLKISPSFSEILFIYDNCNSALSIKTSKIVDIRLLSRQLMNAVHDQMKRNSFYITTRHNSYLISSTSTQIYTSWTFMLLCYIKWFQSQDCQNVTTKEGKTTFNEFASRFSIVHTPEHPQIPLFMLKTMSRLIELRAHLTEGIFRVSAANDKQKTLYDNVNRGYYELLEIEEEKGAIALLIFEYVKNLSEPLIPFVLYDDCFSVLSKQNSSPTDVLNKIQDPNKTVLLWILGFLRDLTLYSDTNLMTADGLSRVFSPYLFNEISNVKNYTLFSDDDNELHKYMYKRMNDGIKFVEEAIKTAPLLPDKYRFKS